MGPIFFKALIIKELGQYNIFNKTNNTFNTNNAFKKTILIGEWLYSEGDYLDERVCLELIKSDIRFDTLWIVARRDGGAVKGCIYRSRASNREKLNSNVRKGIFMIWIEHWTLGGQQMW